MLLALGGFGGSSVSILKTCSFSTDTRPGLKLILSWADCNGMRIQKLMSFFGLLCWASATCAAGVYMAPPDVARWVSLPGMGTCHLRHDIPQFGTALFSQTGPHDLALSLFVRRPPMTSGEAQLYSISPDWQPPGIRELGVTTISPDVRAFRFGHRQAQQLISELENAHMPSLYFRDWYNEGQVEVRLSNVRFMPSYREHLICLENLLKADPILESERIDSARVLAAGLPEPPETSVYFVTDSWELDKVAMDTLRVFVERLGENPHLSEVVVAVGHADSRGSKRYNHRLARARAKAVREYLISCGLSRRQIRVRSRGERSPVADNDTRYGMASNRRVSVIASY